VDDFEASSRATDRDLSVADTTSAGAPALDTPPFVGERPQTSAPGASSPVLSPSDSPRLDPIMLPFGDEYDDVRDAVQHSLVEALPPGTHEPSLLRARDWSQAPGVSPRGVPPYDEHGRYDLARYPNFVSSHLCVRLDLEHHSLPTGSAAMIAARHPELIGGDGALYVYESSSRSQLSNRRRAVERIVEIVRDAVRANVG
jgi:hypothetical protein